MAQGANRVRELRERLRAAAAMLEAQQYDRALEQVRAALAIDGGSLAAQTLRNRIEVAQQAAETDAVAEEAWTDPPPDLAAAGPDCSPGRCIHPGVNAASWMGFEQRIQERRFRALLESVRAAVSRGDAIGARVAFEEARELQPEAPELDALSGPVALLPVAAAGAGGDGLLYSRALGAVLLLLVGVSLLIGIDRLDERSAVEVLVPQGEPELAAPVSVPAALPAPVAASARPAETLVAFDVAGTFGREAAVATGAPAESERPPGSAAVSNEVNAAPRSNAAPERATPAATRPPFPAATPSVTRPPAGTPAVGTTPPAGSGAPPVLADATPRPSPPSAGSPLPESRALAPAAEPAPASRDAVVASLPASRAEAAAPRADAATGASPSTGRDAVQTAARPPVADRPVADRPVAAVAEVAAAAVIPQDETDVARVLNEYAQRYNQLDASGLREVWPSAPERALARAFADLESQAISFDNCNSVIDVRGATARASCRGRQSWLGPVGNREPRTESRQWQFDLRRDGGDWKIQDAQMTAMR